VIQIYREAIAGKPLSVQARGAAELRQRVDAEIAEMRKAGGHGTFHVPSE
jgi:hypothetical protein